MNEKGWLSTANLGRCKRWWGRQFRIPRAKGLKPSSLWRQRWRWPEGPSGLTMKWKTWQDSLFKNRTKINSEKDLLLKKKKKDSISFWRLQLHLRAEDGGAEQYRRWPPGRPSGLSSRDRSSRRWCRWWRSSRCASSTLGCRSAQRRSAGPHLLEGVCGYSQRGQVHGEKALKTMGRFQQQNIHLTVLEKPQPSKHLLENHP